MKGRREEEVKWAGGRRSWGRWDERAYGARMAEALEPPKAKALRRMGAGAGRVVPRGTRGMGGRSGSGSASQTWGRRGKRWSGARRAAWRVRAQRASSMAPAAPRQCPVRGLVEEQRGREGGASGAEGPKRS